MPTFLFHTLQNVLLWKEWRLQSLGAGRDDTIWKSRILLEAAALHRSQGESWEATPTPWGPHGNPKGKGDLAAQLPVCGCIKARRKHQMLWEKKHSQKQHSHTCGSSVQTFPLQKTRSVGLSHSLWSTLQKYLWLLYVPLSPTPVKIFCVFGLFWDSVAKLRMTLNVWSCWSHLPNAGMHHHHCAWF